MPIHCLHVKVETLDLQHNTPHVFARGTTCAEGGLEPYIVWGPMVSPPGLSMLPSHRSVR